MWSTNRDNLLRVSHVYGRLFCVGKSSLISHSRWQLRGGYDSNRLISSCGLLRCSNGRDTGSTMRTETLPPPETNNALVLLAADKLLAIGAPAPNARTCESMPPPTVIGSFPVPVGILVPFAVRTCISINRNVITQTRVILIAMWRCTPWWHMVIWPDGRSVQGHGSNGIWTPRLKQLYT